MQARQIRKYHNILAHPNIALIGENIWRSQTVHALRESNCSSMPTGDVLSQQVCIENERRERVVDRPVRPVFIKTLNDPTAVGQLQVGMCALWRWDCSHGLRFGPGPPVKAT